MRSERGNTGGKPQGFLIGGVEIPAETLDPGLYIVATPIGNLGDVTLRALATLAAADLIACEDTRVTRILTGRYGIRTPLSAYHEHNAAEQRPRLLAMLGEGRTVALVSDAGTPLISDPGYRLVLEAAAAGHQVFPIPGASALLAALVTAGLPTDAFLFAGFLPEREGQRQKRLAALKAVPATLVFYESPRRLVESLGALAEAFGRDRPATVARELTKTFETVRRGTLGSLADTYASEDTPKGEIVIVVGPPGVDEPAAADVESLLAGLLETMTVRAATDEAVSLTGLPRRDLYRRALALKAATDEAAD